MKDKRKLLLILPFMVFVGTFLLIRSLDNRSYAITNSDGKNVTSDNTSNQPAIPEGTAYSMSRKNTYSWHIISHNGGDASGTKLLHSKPNEAGQRYYAVAYCATVGKTLSSSENRTRYSIDSPYVTSLDVVQKNKYKMVMPYMYPYINLGASHENGNTLKWYLYNSLGDTVYKQYDFDSLNVNEAITAVQAAIWNIQKKKSYETNPDDVYQYSGTTLASFSRFNTCEEYGYDGNEMLTSEEEQWMRDSSLEDCKKGEGNFYKYVVSHHVSDPNDARYDEHMADRINILTRWYTTLNLPTENAGVTEYFNLESSDFTNDVLTVTFSTNISEYNIAFYQAGQSQPLTSEKIGDNRYQVTGLNIPANGQAVINVEVSSNTTSNQVIYYISSSGQDFISLEKTYYTRKENLSITTENKKGKIIIYKVENDNGNVEVGNNGSGDFDASKCGGNGCLSNAKFELYYGGTSPQNLVRIFETDYTDANTVTNTVTFDNLPLGTYYLKETQPAYGYDIYKFNVGTNGNNGYVDSNGFITINLTENGQTLGVIVSNKKTRICISKVGNDDPSNILDGAEFEIQDIDGNIISTFTTSSQEGPYCFDEEHHNSLQSGSYFLKEIKAPLGYSIDPKKYHFVVGNVESNIENLQDIDSPITVNSVNNNITITNKKGFTMSKSDLSDGACVAGATLTIRDKDGNTKNGWSWKSTCIDKDGKGEDSHTVPICLTPEEEQSYGDTGCLGTGNYTLTEEIPAKGYATAESTNFVIDSNGKISCGTDENGNNKSCGEMKDAPTEVCIYKVKKGTKEVLTGAEFEIYQKLTQIACALDNDGKCINRDNYSLSLYTKITSSKDPCIPYFPVGEYVIKETKAPDGYKLPENNETTITVEDKAGHQDFYIENEVAVPKTAMDYSVTVVIIASVFLMFGIGLVGYYEYKKGH